MTLNDIHDLVSAAVGQNTLNITAEKINDQAHGSVCIKQVLDLLQSGNGIVVEPSESELNGTQLTFGGNARILDLDSSVKFTLTDADSGPRSCVVEIELSDPIAPRSLVDKKLFGIPEGIKTADFFGLSFADVSLVAGSDTRTATLTITGSETTNKVYLKVQVNLPAGNAQVFNSCRVTIDALEQPLTINPAQVAEWAGAKDTFAGLPVEFIGLNDFGLKSLTLSLNIRNGSVLAIRIVVSTNKVWNFTDNFGLKNIAVVADVTSPLTSPTIDLRGEAQISLGNSLSLDCVITFPIGNNECTLSVSTMESFKLSDLANLPGGAVINQTPLGLPVATTAIGVGLNDLTFILDLKAPQKLQAISLNVTTNFTWDLLPGILSISNPELLLELTGSPRAWQVDAELRGVLDLYLLERTEENPGNVRVDFTMSRIEGRWNLAAELFDEIPILAAANKLGLGDKFPEVLKDLSLTGLSAQYTTPSRTEPAEFSFNTEITLPQATLGDFELKNSSLSVSYRRAQKTSMTLGVALSLPQFNDAQMTLMFIYEQGWAIVIEALGLRLAYDSNKKIAELSLGDKTIGDLIKAVYSLVKSGETARLPEPWNFLERVSLNGAKFTINFKERAFGITYAFTPESDLGFVTLKEVAISYKSGVGVRMKIVGRLFGKSAYQDFDFNPSNPGSALPVPIPGGELIDLRFLALGQRLQLRPAQRVRETIAVMSNAFNVDNPKSILAPDSGLKFDTRSGLLVGVDFSLLGFLSMALVFNDGVIAGVSLGLSTARARYFQGLDFEVLYKKVNESVGVYQIDLQLPDAIRQIELGQVSITAPSISLELYTNGNFRVDLGFPKNNDFARSFQLQVFPFIGAGGFYFAMLDGATTPRLPRDNAFPPDQFPGRFRPVLAFGLGLKIGLGKSINRGIFAAELSLCFEGVLEGTLAFFNGANDGLPDSLYYWMQGTLGVVGRIQGSVRFTVITAEVSLVVALRVGVTLESFQPLVLSFSASVKVDLVVKIGAGWLSVDVSCAFSTEISEQFTIPVRNPGTPAWAIRPAPGVRQITPASSRSKRGKASASKVRSLSEGALLPALRLAAQSLRPQAFQPLPAMIWDIIEVPDDKREELRLLFRPQFTVAAVEGEDGEKEQATHCVALLFLKSIGTASPGNQPKTVPAGQDQPSDFDRFAKAMLLWAIHSLDTNIELELNDLLNAEISVEELQGIYRVLTHKARGAAPFTGVQVIEFLRQYFDIAIEAQRRPFNGVEADSGYYDKGRPTVAIFPMIPDLGVEARLTLRPDETDGSEDYKLLHYSVRFNEQTVVPLTYHDEILKYFEKVVAEFRTDIEREVDAADSDPPLQELPQAGGRSIAEFVFEDYFLMIMRDVIQGSLDLMKNQFPDRESIEVKTLIRELLVKKRFQNLSGMVSRFMLPGTRLPKPSYLLEDVRGLWPGGEPAPLYLLTGQQFELPKFDQPPDETRYVQCDIELLSPESEDSFYQYVLAGHRERGELIEDENVEELIITLKEDNPGEDGEPGQDLGWIDALRKASLQPAVQMPFKKIRMSRVEPRRFALANRMKFVPRQTLQFSLGPKNRPLGDPTIWTLAEGLRLIIAEPRPTIPAFGLDLGSQESGSGRWTFREALAYDWAAEFTVTIRKTALSDPLDDASIPLAYEIENVDDEGVQLLEKIIRRAALNRSLIKEIHLLYQSRDVDGAPMLVADRPDGIGAFILSTLADVPSPKATTPNLFATHPLEMLQLLWRSSLLGSGGHYLYYQSKGRTPDNPNQIEVGFPEGIFDGDGVGKITILIRFDFQSADVLPFVNRVVVGEATTAETKFFATSLRKMTSILVNSTTRIAEILERYRVSIYDLAKAIGGKSLQSAPIEFEGWSHQVAPNESWDQIGKRYRMPGAAVRAANGNPEGDPAPFSVVTIPKIRFQTAKDETLRGIADSFKQKDRFREELVLSPLAELLLQNVEKVALEIPVGEAIEIRLWEQLSVRLPMLPPGHAGFAVRRTFPEIAQDVNPSPKEQLDFLYSFLGCRVTENRWFNGSIEVPSDGPQVPSDAPEDNAPTAARRSECQYTKLIPCFKFNKAATVPHPSLTDPMRNPYRGVGETLVVGFDWLDGFGNKTFSPFNPQKKKDQDNNLFPLRLGYTDELIGIESWPAVSAGYLATIDGQDGSKPQVLVDLDFDVSRYVPHGGGQRTTADVKKIARADLEVFRRVYYQLTWGTMRVSLDTTIDGLSETLDPKLVPGESAQVALIRFVGSIIDYLASIIDPAYKFRFTEFHPSKEVPTKALSEIAETQGVSEITLQIFNPLLPHELTADVQIVVPDIAFPTGIRLGRSVSLSNPATLFPLTVKLKLERLDRSDDGFIDAKDAQDGPVEEDGFLDVPAVRSATTLLDPLTMMAGNSGGRESGAIRKFAQEFEQVFPITRLATGLARAEDVGSNSRNRFWVVRTGPQDRTKWIRCLVQSNQQHFFAPVPLATRLLSAANLAVFDYAKDEASNQYVLKPATASYGGIDLDEWATRFVSAMDTVLLPQYAVPIYILEQQQVGSFYSTLLKAKQSIADAIAKSVDRIAENGGGDLPQAQELLRRRLLVQLSAAYEIDTIVQIGVNVTSPYKLLSASQPGDNASDLFQSIDDVPKLFGQPTAALTRASAEKIDFSLSSAKIPLVNGQSYLTFLFDSKRAMPEQMLEVNLSYNATALEYEISGLPGLPASRSSSWLTFINPLQIAGGGSPVNVKIPIPIRAYPIPPTLNHQNVSAVDDLSEPELKIEETRHYEYSYDYRRAGPGHDLVYTAPRFNVKLNKTVAPHSAEAGVDLFQALASFDRVWDQLRKTLLTLPEVLTLPSNNEDRQKALSALSAFAQIASMVASTWESWPAARDRRYMGAEDPGADEYLYVISERPQDSGVWEVIVRQCKRPEAIVRIPAIEIEGWDREEIDTENINERHFQYRNNEGLMTENKAKALPVRRIVFEELDILNKQNVWAGVRLTRNENLFGDRACAQGPPQTSRKFVYHTPMIRFPEILTPLLEYAGPIDIARLPNEPGKYLDQAEKRSLEDHLILLFKRFFESVGQSRDAIEGRRIQLTCRYQYDLDHAPSYLSGEDADSLLITLPIVMAPPFDFHIPADYADCDEDGSSFICSLSAAIDVWFKARYPSRRNGRLTFDISVYSTLGDAGKLPIYRVNDLRLKLDDVIDLKEGE